MSVDPRRRGPRPPSPVEKVESWEDTELVEMIGVAVRAVEALTPETIEDALGKIDAAFLVAQSTSATLADLEADWASEERDWFHWGMSEIRAETAAVKAYKSILVSARMVLGGRLKRLRRDQAAAALAANQAAAAARKAETAAAHAARKERVEERREVFEKDEQFRKARRDVMFVVHRVLAARRDDTPDGLTAELDNLAAVVAVYDGRRDELRAEHGELHP